MGLVLVISRRRRSSHLLSKDFLSTMNADFDNESGKRNSLNRNRNNTNSYNALYSPVSMEETQVLDDYVESESDKVHGLPRVPRGKGKRVSYGMSSLLEDSSEEEMGGSNSIPFELKT